MGDRIYLGLPPAVKPTLKVGVGYDVLFFNGSIEWSVHGVSPTVFNDYNKKETTEVISLGI
jgi:hypothetical protein